MPCASDRVLTRKRRRASSATVADSLLLQRKERPGDLRSAEADHEILADGEVRVEAAPGASPARRRCGGHGRTFGSVDPDDAAAALETGEGPEQFAGAGPLDPHQRDDLAMGRREDRPRRTRCHATSSKPGRSRGRSRADAFSPPLPVLAGADHQLLGDCLLGQFLPLDHLANLAVPDYRDACGMLDEIAEAMGYENDNSAFPGELVHFTE